MDERDREHVRETERDTTVVYTDGDRGRGRGSGLLIGLALLILLAAILYFIFSGNLNQAADEVGVNVNVETPDVEMPDVDMPDVQVPDVDVPEVDVGNVNIDVQDTEGGEKKNAD